MRQSLVPGTQYCDEFREPTGVPGTDGINPLALPAVLHDLNSYRTGGQTPILWVPEQDSAPGRQTPSP